MADILGNLCTTESALRKVASERRIKYRELIRRGDERWRQKVPLATAKAIDKYHIRERLIQDK